MARPQATINFIGAIFTSRPKIAPAATARRSGLLAPESVMPHLAHIRLQGLWPHPAHPVRLLGRFDATELTYALAPDLDMEWSRQPKETPDAFDLRICRDILAVRGVPEDPEPVAK